MEQPLPTPTEKEIPVPPPEAPIHRAHTYEDDLSKAMNATDAKVVQELLFTARAKEIAQKEYTKSIHQRKWYGVLSFLFLFLAVGGFGYALYHYSQLTVTTQRQVSVGVFPSTAPIVVSDTDIRQTIATLRALDTLDEDKPVLVPLVNNGATLAPISKESFFTFIEAPATEPFIASMDIIRLGVMSTGVEHAPFLILSVPDPQIASKEFLIAEQQLLQLFYRALGIDISNHVAEIGKQFSSAYLYNLPVRILSHTNPETGEEVPTLLYGYATNNTIVITTAPKVLKSVYDTIIRQR